MAPESQICNQGNCLAGGMGTKRNPQPRRSPPFRLTAAASGLGYGVDQGILRENLSFWPLGELFYRMAAVAFTARIWHSSGRCWRLWSPPTPGCGCSSVVEHDLAKVGVEGSSPFARSRTSRPISSRAANWDAQTSHGRAWPLEVQTSEPRNYRQRVTFSELSTSLEDTPMKKFLIS